MSTKIRLVDVFYTKLKFLNKLDNIDFTEVLDLIDGKTISSLYKEFEFSIISKTDDYYIGIVETNQDKEIPPIKNRKNKKTRSIDIIPNEESLVFANVFLYDIKRQILIYEVNRDGCYLKDFIDSTYTLWNKSNKEIRFDLSFPSIIRKGTTDRILNMNYYTKISLEIYNPKDLVKVFNNESSLAGRLIEFNAKKAVESNADVMVVEELVLTKKVNPNGLNRTFVKGFTEKVGFLIKSGLVQNIKEAKVFGYPEDVENSRSIKTIDLLTDTFRDSFRISVVQLHKDIQQEERKQGIIKVYNKILPELKYIIGK